MSGAGEMKQELVIADDEFRASWSSPRRAVITISSSDSSSGDENGRSDVVVSNENRFQDSGGSGKKPKIEINEAVLPLRYHAPLPPVNRIESTAPVLGSGDEISNKESRCKQFWKAGDYVGRDGPHSQPACNGGMDHVRVHPRFLHSNATSHKWALGAFAELLDNSLDEVRTGCSYVKVDMLVNKKDNDSKMLLIQDNGGGMRPDKMRQCMSLGYSVKSKLADTIGQYGNGFKTSTMRLGADVIVFSCCQGKDDGSCPTKSVGLLSYTFLRSTGMEDIIVPMIDFEKREQEWKRVVRSSVDDWYRNLETIIKWSPYTSEDELLLQFQSLDEQGTRIVIYNLWEDDEGQLELDFDADRHDIQIRGVNRDNNKILLAQQFPNATHFLTYRHSLRSYAAILYSRVPPGFRIILRGKDVVHHNLVNDMIHKMQHTYRPQLIADGPPSGFDMVAVVTLGFVKDAEAYINIQGFSVYHKNRLIKPFWRVWNAAGSDGRGVIGVLEANFIEPAHDKQGFERTISLSRLETRLLKLQKDYWRDNCQKVGYAPRRKQLKNVDPEIMELALLNKRKSSMAGNDYFPHEPHGNPSPKSTTRGNSAGQSGHDCNNQTPQKSASYFEEISSPVDCESDSQNESLLKSNPVHVKNQKEMASSPYPDSRVNILRKENAELKKRFLEVGEAKKADLLQLLQFERDNCKSLEAQLLKAEEKIMELDKEQEAVVQIFTEERNHRDIEEEKLRNRLRIASTTIQDLAEKVKLLERRKLPK